MGLFIDLHFRFTPKRNGAPIYHRARLEDKISPSNPHSSKKSDTNGLDRGPMEV